MSCNCVFERDIKKRNVYCPPTSNCQKCVWNVNSGENERRKMQIKYNGLTQREDGLRGLMIRR